MRMIDTHCHLVSEHYRNDTSKWVSEARAVGVEKIINISYDLETIEIMLRQLDECPTLFGAAGIQPHDVQDFGPAAIQKVTQAAQSNKRIVAIGEIGLDGFYKNSPMENQIPCFEGFLDVAIATGLPIIVHVRESHQQVYERLVEFTRAGGRGVIHCFTGTTHEAEKFLNLGFYISLAGIVTFKTAEQLRQTAQMIPNDRILIETDSPYLSPVPVRGKLNHPANIVHTCQAVADVRGVLAHEFAEQTSRNAEALFQRLC